jgi:hypothetical protein
MEINFTEEEYNIIKDKNYSYSKVETEDITLYGMAQVVPGHLWVRVTTGPKKEFLIPKEKVRYIESIEDEFIFKSGA